MSTNYRYERPVPTGRGYGAIADETTKCLWVESYYANQLVSVTNRRTNRTDNTMKVTHTPEEMAKNQKRDLSKSWMSGRVIITKVH
jgi:hypothetical protein